MSATCPVVHVADVAGEYDFSSWAGHDLFFFFLLSTAFIEKEQWTWHEHDRASVENTRVPPSFLFRPCLPSTSISPTSATSAMSRYPSPNSLPRSPPYPPDLPSPRCHPRPHRAHRKLHRQVLVPPWPSLAPPWPLHLTGHSAGTMFELVKDLNDGAQVLNTRSTNPISLNAGCELFITFVTLFPHDSVVCLLILSPPRVSH